MTGPAEAAFAEAGVAAPPCAVCGARMSRERRPWQFRCAACGFRAATPPEGEGSPAATALDEGTREGALEPLRRANFERVLDAMGRSQEPQGRRLLDVGCAHGWFLEAAAGRGYEATGVEPDAAMHALASARARDVVLGYFPDALPPDALFDAIVFNDSFEHLPDVNAALAACRRMLREDGLVVLNLPSSSGAVFRAATLLDRVAVRGPLDRLWQRGFPSPHLSYFSPDALASLAARHGFREVHRGALRTVTLGGLWKRLRYDAAGSVVGAAATWCAVALSLPALRLLASDISLQLFAKEADAGRGDSSARGGREP